MEKSWKIRQAIESDSPIIFEMILELAEFEKLSHAVVGSEASLRVSVFDQGYAQALIVEEAGLPVGFALYFFNYSTFETRPGLYLEDIYIRPEHRSKGYGKALIKKLAQIGLEKDCTRMEWFVLDWNEDAIDFYKSLGARPMDEWTVYRLEGEALKNLGSQ